MGIKPAQGFEVLRTAVDEIAGTPQAVLIGVEPDLRQLVLKRLEATLNIADDVGAHIRTSERMRALSVGCF